MIEVSKESLCINKLISEKKEIVIVEGDMIVPDSKPDILNTICTSGVVSIYKKDILNEKVRLDGNLNTYIMYIPDGEEDIVRGLNTTLDFSEVIDIPNCTEEMSMNDTVKVSSIECKVLNGRKINIKATLEIMIQIYSSENIDIINGEINNHKETIKLSENYIGNVGSIDVGTAVISERKQMADAGIVFLTIALDTNTMKFLNFLGSIFLKNLILYIEKRISSFN